jgi:two-component system, OmpR family, alkaline phosphatase synthesis response regulator PhoP
MKRILVVDDSEVNAYLISSLYKFNKAVEVILELESSKAIETIRNKKPDLIFLDLIMPNVDGFQILREIKNLPDLSDIPIIVVSARHDDWAIQEANKYNIIEYMKKPLDLSFIEKRIVQILDLNPGLNR